MTSTPPIPLTALFTPPRIRPPKPSRHTRKHLTMASTNSPSISPTSLTSSTSPMDSSSSSTSSSNPAAMAANALSLTMLTALSETWELLFKCLHTPLPELSELLKGWAETKELQGSYLLSNGAMVCARPKDDPAHAQKPGHMLNEVQDTTSTTPLDASRFLASTTSGVPVVAAAQGLKTMASDRAARLRVFELLGGGVAGAKKQKVEDSEREGVVEDLRQALALAWMAAWVQVLSASPATPHELLAASKGLIKTPYITSLTAIPSPSAPGSYKGLAHEPLVDEIKRLWPALKRTVLRALEWDAHVPTLAAAAEWCKVVGAKQLPTQFLEAQVDAWGGVGWVQKAQMPKMGEQGKGGMGMEGKGGKVEGVMAGEGEVRSGLSLQPQWFYGGNLEILSPQTAEWQALVSLE
ncbi:hypothetical protein EDC01DRAFT_756598 [Geopyxis carbonaria]|nr:hypothetical protein EDC01DRAFT_756598 [Geopyxis carbonaria]